MIATPSRIILHAPNLAKPDATPDDATRWSILPATWGELHLWGLELDREEDAVWIMSYSSRVPGGCNCRSHWLKVLDQFPPRFGDKFAWTVDVHNAVRRHLKQAELSLEEARVFWTARRDEINRQLNPTAS